MSASSAQVLEPSAGWAVVIALGVGFSVVMLGVSYLQERYTQYSVKNNEEFTSASRSVKTGLIAASIVSAWTWAATLLQSSTVAFNFGVSGPFWYAAGACVQVLLFAMMAAKTKLNAPYAHTYLEVVKTRWGTLSHVTHTFFAIAANILVGSMLILGGSATVNQLTGMPTLAAVFLTPASVAIYTLLGGLRATFFADYSHTVILLAIIFAFAFEVYASSDKIGSPQRMWELLEAAAPVAGNARGSYVTMRSLSGLKFGIINICGNFSTVFVDQAYHQRGIASTPTTATKGFILGGLAWYAVPMLTASSMGLAARALYGNDPDMPELSSSEVTAGLAAPAAAAALLGRSGAAAMLILLYLAVTSAASAQLIAVASVFTYDIWKPYINPNASPRQLAWVSHGAVAFWSIALGVLGTIFFYIGIGMGWLYTFMGIILAPAVFPVFACLTWSRTNRNGALVGMITGFCLGVMSWLVTASQMYGELTVETTGSDDPLLAGNLVSIVVPTIITCVWSAVSPARYTFEETRAMNAPVVPPASIVHSDAGSQSPSSQRESDSDEKDVDQETEKAGAIESRSAPVPAAAEKATRPGDESDVYRDIRRGGLDPEQLQRSVKTAVRVALPLSFLLLIFMPCMAIIPARFTPAGLGAWVGIWIAWLFFSTGIVVILPLWESRVALGEVCVGVWKDITGRGERKAV